MGSSFEESLYRAVLAEDMEAISRALSKGKIHL